jgi:hypothetical protein
MQETPANESRTMTSELDQAESDLNKEGHNVAMLRQLAGALPRVSEESLGSAIAEFHNFGGRFPYWADCDVGALVLEDVADDMLPGPRRALLYQNAAYRAQWCASAATAGGEGMARSLHLERVRAKLRAEPAAPGGRGTVARVDDANAHDGPAPR